MQEQISSVQKLINTAIEFFVNYSFQVLGAVIVLAVGFLIAGWTSNLIMQLLEKKKMDITLSKFLAGTVRIVIKIPFPQQETRILSGSSELA